MIVFGFVPFRSYYLPSLKISFHSIHSLAKVTSAISLLMPALLQLIIEAIEAIDIESAFIEFHQSILDLLHTISMLFDHVVDIAFSHLDKSSFTIPTLKHFLIGIIALHLIACLTCLVQLAPSTTSQSKQMILNTPSSSRIRNCAEPRQIIIERGNTSSSIPPHIFLLNHLHPTTSLWPGYYLRVFDEASRGDGVLRLDREVVERGLSEGRVVLRSPPVSTGM